jgi:hypothetical protein
MDQIGQVRSRVLCEQLPKIESFVRYLTYYRMFPQTHFFVQSDFWQDVSDALLCVAILAWCDVFGSCSNDFHWSKLVEEMPEEVVLAFKSHIHKLTGLTDEGYEKYQNYVKTLRDKYFAHTDRDWQEHIWDAPDFDKAMKIVKAYENWVNELLVKEGSPCPEYCSLDDIEKEAKRQVKEALAYKTPQRNA